jgi:hypothetical protein
MLKDTSVPWSKDDTTATVLCCRLLRVSALLLARSRSLSASKDLFELELRWEDETEALRARPA